MSRPFHILTELFSFLFSEAIDAFFCPREEEIVHEHRHDDSDRNAREDIGRKMHQIIQARERDDRGDDQRQNAEFLVGEEYCCCRGKRADSVSGRKRGVVRLSDQRNQIRIDLIGARTSYDVLDDQVREDVGKRDRHKHLQTGTARAAENDQNHSERNTHIAVIIDRGKE